MTISVRALEEAMALAQPNVWNLASLIFPSSSSLNWNVSASPHASEPTVAVPSGWSIVPTFRGFRKWSIIFSE